MATTATTKRQTIACLTCGRPVPQPETGRPRNYCDNGDRCKEKARRNRNRDRERVSRLAVGYTPADAGEPEVATPTDPDTCVCRVCGEVEATVGPPGNPILCGGCAAA